MTFYTVSEAAELLRVSSMALYRAIHEDALPTVWIGHRLIIPAKAVERLVEDALTIGGCADVAELTAARRHGSIKTELVRQGWS